jgi:Family of unknown function (DUF5681)
VPGVLLRVRACGRARRVSFASKQAKENKAMQFQKGQSGNPAGRPRGSRNRTTILMQALLADRAEAIGRKVIQLAEDGDMAAIRLCMDRLAPAPKDEPVDIELPPLEKPADSVATRRIDETGHPQTPGLSTVGGRRAGYARRYRGQAPTPDRGRPGKHRRRIRACSLETTRREMSHRDLRGPSRDGGTNLCV